MNPPTPMSTFLSGLMLAAPEIWLLATALIVMLAEVLGGGWARRNIGLLALAAIVPPAWATLAQMGAESQIGFGGLYKLDAMAVVLKLSAYVAVAVTLIYSANYARDRQMRHAEYYSLMLFALLGIMVMISAHNLLMIYLGVELMSLSLYALAAVRRDDAASTEAAMKYFVLGALASGFLLYGMSMIYGATGALDIPDIAVRLTSPSTNRVALACGVVFIVAGLAFKFGVVPFHMWVPDVYHGTPTAATLMIAAAPKLATFAITFRLLVEGLITMAPDWQKMLAMIAIGSIIFGNLVAIAQSNLKRMLAYSTIAQIGFVLLGLMTGVQDGKTEFAVDAYGAAMFYVVTYVLTTLAGFGVILLLARRGVEADRLEDLRGLNSTSPWLAFVMLIVMFSLMGIPPTVGFYAKLAVLQAVVRAGQLNLAVVAVLASLIGAFYYLRIVRLMYFDNAPSRAAPAHDEAVSANRGARLTLGVNGLMVLALGLLPGPLMAVCADAVRRALGG